MQTIDTETRRTSLLRSMPQVGRLIASDEFRPLIEAFSRREVTRELRSELERLRRDVSNGAIGADALDSTAISRRVAQRVVQGRLSYHRRAINGTGIVIHTGLGRASMAPEVAEALREGALHPVCLELDLTTGARGGRDDGCASLLQTLTDCEAATVVNNNAAATMLLVAALARGKRVIVSRGELVEIGGSYRIPEIMEESGAVLAAVGTTNCTHLKDYRAAIDSNTGLILKVHTSNYRVCGFTSEVPIEQLVELGREHGIPVVHDLGSGSLIDLARALGEGEPLVQRSLKAGVDAACFSGDKLLGGPQAGIIVGTASVVDRCRRHPLFRAFRPGRLTYIALEATLRLYLDGPEAAANRVPTLRRLLAPSTELRRRASKLARRLGALPRLRCRTIRVDSLAGGGSLPTVGLPSWGVSISISDKDLREVAAALRQGPLPIIVRVHDSELLIDARTLDDEDLPAIVSRLNEILADT